MNELIGGYKPLTPMVTAGSGSARWCIASRGLERFFLKQFLSPVFPVDESSALGRRQLERCEAFERQKQRLYKAISLVIGDTLVPVLDFFRYERHYYAVSEAVPSGHIAAENVWELSPSERRALLLQLALCLQRLHTQGIVHADLKPDHVLLLRHPDGFHARLIDLDSGFLADDPPKTQRELEGDPVYLSPEAFLCMAGQPAKLTCKIDTFAFGALFHCLWTGELPSFDHGRYAYLYEAVLDGAKPVLSPALPDEYADVIGRMLLKDPSCRPGDGELVSILGAPAFFGEDRAYEEARPLNGLTRFMKKSIRI